MSAANPNANAPRIPNVAVRCAHHNLCGLHLRAGATVGLVVDHGRLVIEPSPRPHYLLEELLAQCDPSVEISSDDRAWLDSKPVGDELL